MEPIPQHAVFTFPDVEIFSDFDSGNIAKAEQFEDRWFLLWTGPDGMGTGGENSCRTWFYFKVSTTNMVSMKFTIKNLNMQCKLFKDGMKPVYKTENQDWERLACEIQTAQSNGNFEITFEHFFTQAVTFFAFTYPWSFSQHLDFIKDLKLTCDFSSIYFYAENMIKSLEGRPCHMLTISSFNGILEKKEKKIQNLFPDNEPRCAKFTGKKIIFVSARVHPGELPGSHVMNGFLKFICSNDNRAGILRDLFVFKVIPILNPDGVFRGYYRTDTKGANLNRYYNSPSLADHPTIYATKELFNYYQKVSEVFMYVDLHGHASKKGCFVYGNYLEFKDQIETCLFTKIMAMNCINFDFLGSNFTESNMRASDKRDGLSKEGSGRVAFYKQTNIIRCYTLECNYNTGRVINTITAPEDDVTDNSSSIYSGGHPRYTVKIFEDVGRAIAITALDMVGSNPISRISSLQDLKVEVAAYIASLIPFRFDPAIKKASKSIADLDNYFYEKSREENKKPPRPEKKPLISRNRSDGKREESSSKDNYVAVKDESLVIPPIGRRERRSEPLKDKPKDTSKESRKDIRRSSSKEKGSEIKGVAVVQIKEIVFVPQTKESSSQRGRSMNKRISRKIITHSSSLNQRKTDS